MLHGCRVLIAVHSWIPLICSNYKLYGVSSCIGPGGIVENLISKLPSFVDSNSSLQTPPTSWLQQIPIRWQKAISNSWKFLTTIFPHFRKYLTNFARPFQLSIQHNYFSYWFNMVPSHDFSITYVHLFRKHEQCHLCSMQGLRRLN